MLLLHVLLTLRLLCCQHPLRLLDWGRSPLHCTHNLSVDFLFLQEGSGFQQMISDQARRFFVQLFLDFLSPSIHANFLCNTDKRALEKTISIETRQLRPEHRKKNWVNELVMALPITCGEALQRFCRFSMMPLFSRIEAFVFELAVPGERSDARRKSGEGLVFIGRRACFHTRAIVGCFRLEFDRRVFRQAAGTELDRPDSPSWACESHLTTSTISASKVCGILSCDSNCRTECP